MGTTIVVTTAPSEADQQLLLDRLVAFNDAVAGPSGYEPVLILLKTDDGETVGGLSAKISYDWLFIELLIVPEESRGSGMGTELMKAAEGIARDRRCVGVWLDTHGFQAPEFYKRLGYELFGEIPEHPRGTSRYFLRKRI